MKKILNTKIKISTFITILVCLFLAFYFKNIFYQTKKSVVQIEKVKQELIVDNNGNNHFRKEFQNNTSEIEKKKIDSLKKVLSMKNSELELKDVQLLAVTNLNASISDTLKTFKLEKDALNNKIWNFEKTYADGTKSKITMFEKDTTIIQNTDLKLAITDFSAKKDGKKNYYIDVTSQNEGFKLNGSEVLRIPIKEPKDLFQLNLGTAYFKGIGNQINFATSELKLWILPDNAVVPNLGTGLIWFMNDGRIYPYYKIGVDIRLKSVQK